MEKIRTGKGKLSVKPMDVFIICAVFLVIVAVIGQDIAVYLINKADSSEQLRIDFVARSVEKTDAEALTEAQNRSEKGLDVRSGLRSLGSLDGEISASNVVVEGEESTHLCDLTGSMLCRGKTENGTVSLHGYGEVKEGDILSVYVNDTLIFVELTEISAAEG